ncbi:NADP-dependent oxidoreductase [Chryseolinea sp. H1M3-3]|uniref:NADP-dependent oxidoreductase n=1 Tax=Chryseolinea sp. H1M3-3 TaxID=3034144 RepID=UPI0023ED9B45|nr:NADP-dependent oxidoreductase [Chryseolinea sp. H1M3-3]
MKAYTLKQIGGVENLVQKEIPTPQIKNNQVLVKVKAIGINPVDAFVRSSEQGLSIFVNPGKGEEVILGWDIAGIIETVGSEVNGLKTGDEVFGLINFKGHGKAYAEYVAVDAAQVALKPGNISFEAAGAATLAALTAWQALVTHAQIKKDDKVLIHGASGGVGHYAVQIAKHVGAFVIGVGSSENKDFILSLGADQFIDYKKEKFEEIVRDADVILDSLDKENLKRSFSALKTGGRLVSLITFFDDELKALIAHKKAQAYRMTVESNGNDMKSLADLLQQGALRSHVTKVYPFDQLPDAHIQVETHKTRGKIVVTV